MKLWMVLQKTDNEYIDLMKNNKIYYQQQYKYFIEENDQDLQFAYIWLANKMRKKVFSLHQFPFHLYYKIEGSQNPLDNKLFGINSPGEYIIINFDIPNKEVLLYDDDLFVICLNQGYVSLSEQEDIEFDHIYKFLPKLIRMNYYQIFKTDKFNCIEQRFVNMYKKDLYKSWERIFKINLPNNNWSIISQDKTIFGLVWELKKENIIDIINFNVSQEEHDKYYNW